jgi:hypothetical protein
MYKILWSIAGLAAVALGTAVFGAEVNNNDVRSQSAKITALSHQESTDRREIATLRAEVHAFSAAHSGAP